jgi:phosphatidylglycerol:prolipoprotein diacylglycerol transferase
VGFGSAALFQATYNYIENPSRGFDIRSGITFIGGFIGGALFFVGVYFLFRKRYSERLYQTISALPCSVIIAHAFGRVGCFFAGCCYGKPTDSFLGVQFPRLSQPVHPTQLYEAAFLFVLFAVTAYLVLKKDFKHNLSLYFIAYGVFRFFIEYLRDDARGELVGGITPSQFWSILMVVFGVIMIFVLEYFFKKAKNNESDVTVEASQD